MSEFGGIDIGAPGEGAVGAPEELSEEAKQRFAAAAAAMAQIRREEKRSKKRDDQVARVILQFLAQDGNTHLFLLISRLVARDCPSIFILAVVSLMIDEKNIDGTILQLSTFVLQEFFLKQGKATPFDKVQPLAGSILQTVFEPFVAAARQKLLESKAQENSDGEYHSRRTFRTCAHL